MQGDSCHRPPGQGGSTGCIVRVAPPYIPYAPALHSQGIDLDRVLVVRGHTGARGNQDVLWAMERFISRERNEPPDIDVDFEHERREEVIQYIYRKYSRERAALAATVITYRTRNAVRDVGKALGMEKAQVGVLAGLAQWWGGKEIAAQQIGEAGFDPKAPAVSRFYRTALTGMPPAAGAKSWSRLRTKHSNNENLALHGHRKPTCPMNQLKIPAVPSGSGTHSQP